MGLAKWTSCAGALAVLSLSGQARAQSAPTCSFDPATAAVTVTVNGQKASLTRAAGGMIRLNGAACGAATASNTDSISITGGAGRDVVMVQGDFQPGRTPEPGVSEIEIAVAGSIDNLTLILGAGDDVAIYSGTGIDIGGDGDDDVIGSAPVSVRGGAGNDILDFALSTFPVSLYGADGDDHLIGGSSGNFLSGQDGDDILEGNGSNDRLDGGQGNDVELGGDGIDVFQEGPAPNGADLLDGGNTRADKVDYGKRTTGVTITLDAGVDDGAPGEGDEIVRVEQAIGGSGDDVMVGNSLVNNFQGRAGNDQLFGRENHDQLYGGPGDDLIQGDAGRNSLFGESGNDTLIGSPVSDDRFFGGDGDDQISGNDDNRGERVDCGAGNDSVVFNDQDTFINCEGI